jgi:hypothetical protein
MMTQLFEQKMRWLMIEMGFTWKKKRGEFVMIGEPDVRVPLELVENEQVRYGTFQRAMLVHVRRQREKREAKS